MKHQVIFIIIFILFGWLSANAQKSKLQYVLVEVYADSNLVTLDTTIKHSVRIYSLKKNTKLKIEEVSQQLFYSKRSKCFENLLLDIDGSELKFSISTKRLPGKFAVLKVYLDKDAKSNNPALLVKNGDVILTLNACAGKCHKVEIIQPPIVISNNKLTTGYKVLDNYILK